MNDLVSIITPSYNCSRFLEQTIQSVLAQTYTNWEMMIVDDHSDDGSFEIAKKYSESDPRISVYRLPENSGPAVARNKAIEMAKGRFMAFLDSDDLWETEKLASQIRFMKEEGHAFTYTYYSVINEEGFSLDKIMKPPERLNYNDMLKSNRIGCLTAIYDSEKLGKVYMPDILKRQDYALWLKLLKLNEYAYCLPEPLAHYRIRNSSVSARKIDLLKYNWRLFHDIERFYKVKASYYLFLNIIYKLSNN